MRFDEFKSYILNEKYPDGLNSQYFILKKELSLHNINIEMFNFKKLDSYQIIIFIGYPRNNIKTKFLFKQKKIFFLIINECEVVSGLKLTNIDTSKFSEIFNITSEKVNNFNVTKIFDCSYNYRKISNIKKKLFCCVAANKSSFHENEIYSERKKIINWLSKNAYNECDLYGNNWNRIAFPTNNKYFSYLNSKYFNSIFKLFYSTPKIWKGKTNNKYQTISEYKFTLAFENAKNYQGYIMEKIIDCLFSSTVPIYYGAIDIEKYIPKNCFIDYRDLSNPKKLYEYIKNMKERDYQQYLINADKFINSSNFKIFSHKHYADTFLKAIKKYF